MRIWINHSSTFVFTSICCCTSFGNAWAPYLCTLRSGTHALVIARSPPRPRSGIARSGTAAWAPTNIECLESPIDIQSSLIQSLGSPPLHIKPPSLLPSIILKGHRSRETFRHTYLCLPTVARPTDHLRHRNDRLDSSSTYGLPHLFIFEFDT
jgi:hypothetical protein